MRIWLIYDSGDPQANMEQTEGFDSQSLAEARCEELNERDYPDLKLDADGEPEGDCWTWTFVEVEIHA